MAVSYEKQMRDKAKAANKGLMTIDLISPSKRPGRFGGRMTIQGPVDANEARLIADFIVKTIEERQQPTNQTQGAGL